MKHFNLIAAGAALFTSITVYAEGGKVGGGGAVVVCKNTAGRITTVKLLDLYQAELGGAKVRRSSEPIDVQVKSALKKLEVRLGYDIQQMIGSVKTTKLPLNVSSSQKYDLGSSPVLVEDGCTHEWVAFYKDKEESLQIVTKYYDRMSNTDKAALLIHEAIYRIKRGYRGELDSEVTRKIVGEIFVSTSDPTRIDKLTRDISLNSSQIIESTGEGTDLILDLVFKPADDVEIPDPFTFRCYDRSWNVLYVSTSSVSAGDFSVNLRDCAAFRLSLSGDGVRSKWEMTIRESNELITMRTLEGYSDSLFKIYPKNL